MTRHKFLVWAGLALAAAVPNLQAAATREARLERTSLQRAEAAGRSAAFVGSTGGQVFFLEPTATGLIQRVFGASQPVHRAYGFSADGARVAYRPLEDGRPTGTLWVEELATGKATALPLPGYVIEAAWSPADRSLLAYTYSSGEGDYGVALYDLERATIHDIQSKYVLADWLTWDNNGTGLYFFDAVDHVRQSRDLLTGKTMHDSTYAELAPRHFALGTRTVRELPLQAVPAGFPALKQTARPEVLSEPLFELPRKAGGERLEAADLPADIYAFTVAVPERGIEIVGENLLGDGALSLGGRVLATGKLLGVVSEGIVVSASSGPARVTSLVRWDGTTTEITRAVVSYNLPLKTATVTQGGCSYPAPGNCNSGFSHTCGSSMAYAYDMWQSAGHALASATGTVANRMNTVTCNRCDSTDCADYVAGCSDANANYGWGNAVVIEHGDGTWTKYTHMAYNSVQVAMGDATCPGRYIGNQGHTGCTSGTGCGDHLHFQRQTGSGFSSPSTSIDFADANDPLSCGSTYTSASTETTSCGGGGGYTFTCDNGQGCYSAFGPTQYWHTQTTCGGTSLGQNGSMIWTYVNGTALSNYARWTPTLSGAGNYTVSVFIPRCYGTSVQAKYTIRANSATYTATVNQNAIYDQWVTLGTYYFAASGTQYVELGDNTGEATSTLRQLAFDAVRFVK